jgi:phage shock protein PspC (stress-responsive transcriptional regulator)
MVRGAAAVHAGAMTETPLPPAPGTEGPRTTRDEARDLGRIRRSTTDRKVAGVAGGLGRHLDVDPLLLRVAFVVLTFFGGAGLIVYAAGWLLVPEDDGSEAVVRLEDRTRGVVLAVVGVIAGVSVVAELAGNSWGPFWFPWQLVVVAVVAAVLLSRRDGGYPAPAGPGGGPVGAAGGPVPTGGPTWVPPTAPAPVVRDPRRRGPLLLWTTLALVVLAEGILMSVDLSGVAVADGAYAALALGIIGAALVLGAFFGRGGGLVLVGLLAVPVLLISTLEDRIDADPQRETPDSAASVDPEYRLGLGELVLDLTEVEDLEELDGRVLDITVQVGRIEVVVPEEGLTVQATGRIGGPGEVSLFGERRGGIETLVREAHDGGPGSPVLVLQTETNLGEIVVTTR